MKRSLFRTNELTGKSCEGGLFDIGESNVPYEFYSSSSVLHGNVLVSDTDNGPFNLENNTPPVEETITALEIEVNEMLELVPEVMEQLANVGVSAQMLDFFKLVDSGKFPMDNIAFELWLEVVKWFSTDNAVDMRYSTVTKKFWKLGYRHFGGRFINFMSGFKLSGQIAAGEINRGSLPTGKSNINFAVPSVNVLRNFDPYEVNICDTNPSKPGIFVDVIETLAITMKDKSCCITFDGKKLKQGLTKTDGDIDLLGFEKEPSLMDKKLILENLLKPMNDIIDSLKESENCDLCSINDEQKAEFREIYKETLKTVSEHILNARDLKKKKEYAKGKLIERSGLGNWKNGKFAYAISNTIAFIHDIDIYLGCAYDVITEVTRCICYLQGSTIFEGDSLNLFDRGNSAYCGIDCDINGNDTRQIKQRSEEWFAARKEAKVTGSSIYRAIGLEGLKQQKEYFDHKVCGLPEKEHSDKVKQFMEHGTTNEPNAMATTVGKVVPLLYPNAIVHEEGYIEYGRHEMNPIMIVSPDGSVISKWSDNEEQKTIAAIELKCPVLDVHKQVPARYLLQCLAEIEVLDVDQLIYVSWRQDISTVFVIKRNRQLFEKAYNIAKLMFLSETPKRPTKVSDDVKALQNEIKLACMSNDVVEFKTIVCSQKHNDSETTESLRSTDAFCTSRVVIMTEILVDVYMKYNDLTRQPATEAVVFLCCDLDREWDEHRVRSAPICWFPKGYSLDNETMRRIMEAVLDLCKEKGLHVPAVSYDGQWHNIHVRNSEGKPTTLYQLQRDVWKKVEKMTKPRMLQDIKTLNTEPKWDTETVEDPPQSRKVIFAGNGSISLPSFSPRILQQRIIDRKKQTENEHNMANENGETEIGDIENGEPELSEEINGDEDIINDIEVVNDIDETAVESFTEMNGQLQEGTSNAITLTEEDTSTILEMLKTDVKSNNKAQWNSTGPVDLLSTIQTTDSIKKLRDVEIKIIVRYINNTKVTRKIKESSSKQEKLSKLYACLGLIDRNTATTVSNRKRTMQVKSLSELAFKQVSKMKKAELNIVYAEYLWPNELELWKKSRPEFEEEHGISQGLTEDLFYNPCKSESRNQLEVSCIDSSHLLTRTRRKCCRGGIEKLSNSAWRKVAKTGRTSLSLGMVDAVLEPMTVSVAVSHFTEEVEHEMRQNGDVQAAYLCNDIRQWWLAEDNPGIPAYTRITMRYLQ